MPSVLLSKVGGVHFIHLAASLTVLIGCRGTRFLRRALLHFWFIFSVIWATVGGGANLVQVFPVK